MWQRCCALTRRVPVEMHSGHCPSASTTAVVLFYCTNTGALYPGFCCSMHGAWGLQSGCGAGRGLRLHSKLNCCRLCMGLGSTGCQPKFLHGSYSTACIQCINSLSESRIDLLDGGVTSESLSSTASSWQMWLVEWFSGIGPVPLAQEPSGSGWSFGLYSSTVVKTHCFANIA